MSLRKKLSFSDGNTIYSLEHATYTGFLDAYASFLYPTEILTEVIT